MSLTTITRLCLLEDCFDVLANHHKTVFARGLFLCPCQPSQDCGRIARTLLNFKCHLNPDLSGT